MDGRWEGREYHVVYKDRDEVMTVHVTAAWRQDAPWVLGVLHTVVLVEGGELYMYLNTDKGEMRGLIYLNLSMPELRGLGVVAPLCPFRDSVAYINALKRVKAIAHGLPPHLTRRLVALL